MTKIDLWPTEFGVTDENMPVAILKEQASLLHEKTGWSLEGKVSTHVEGKSFEHYFYIVAPALDNYHYRLFKVKHEIEPFPLWIYSEALPNPEHEAGTSDEFIQALKAIFASEKTRKLVVTLLAQIKS